MEEIIHGKLTIKMAYFIPNRNPAKPARSIWRTVHTEYEITEGEAIEYAKWFRKENSSHPAHEGNPYVDYQWQAYPVTVLR